MKLLTDILISVQAQSRPSEITFEEDQYVKKHIALRAMKQAQEEMREECAKAIEADCWNDSMTMVNQKAAAFNTAKFIRNNVKPSDS